MKVVKRPAFVSGNPNGESGILQPENTTREGAAALTNRPAISTGAIVPAAGSWLLELLACVKELQKGEG